MGRRLPKITPKGNSKFTFDINHLYPLLACGLPITWFRWSFAETHSEGLARNEAAPRPLSLTGAQGSAGKRRPRDFHGSLAAAGPRPTVQGCSENRA